jgi:hypothetical protein
MNIWDRRDCHVVGVEQRRMTSDDRSKKAGTGTMQEEIYLQGSVTVPTAQQRE